MNKLPSRTKGQKPTNTVKSGKCHKSSMNDALHNVRQRRNYFCLWKERRRCLTQEEVIWSWNIERWEYSV